ncbi:uncharacterized protein Gasu_39700 [Galdieria sulphuraria]|uniref:Uncharacterized protein n=1 Tax=Galdieria sulphuraria TaxID=130081 RepID=M2XYN7_GALSU|nr:uncharacterized protein Gasu_39700 [Galdieria sulphuraria]EME28594.1 hypothetical protein Gasu_39700 [Galdieria sulphuraria]|eukprot:XP_005705114.1 hypothetical protein Gasu_39700 [Galdieria sulphuraria]
MLFISFTENFSICLVSKLRYHTRRSCFLSPTFTSRKHPTHRSLQASSQPSQKSYFPFSIKEWISNLHWPLVLYTPPLYWFLRQLALGSGLSLSQRILFSTLAIFLCELFRCLLQDLAALGVAIGRRLGWLRKYRDGKELRLLPHSVPLWELHRHFYVLIGTAVLELISFYEAIFWSERVGLVLLILSQCFFNVMTELQITKDGKCERVQSQARALMLVGDGLYLFICLLYYVGVFPLITSSCCLILLLVYLGLKYTRPSR